MMLVFIAIVRKELATILRSPLGRKITLIHLGVALSALVLGWPVSYILGQANWAPAFAWWVYAEILVLSYLALAVSGDVFELSEKIRPGEWVVYGVATPITVLLGQTTATLLTLLFWLLTSLPVFLLAKGLTPISPDQLRSLALFGALLLTTLTQVGMWMSAMMESRPGRIIAIDIAYAILMLGSLVFQRLPIGIENGLLIQPLEVAAQILHVTPQEVLVGSAVGALVQSTLSPTTAPTALEALPWFSLCLVYGTILVIAGSLSFVMLRQWRRFQS
jgi:hypothetical protein